MEKKYELTEDHKKLLPVYRDKWIANAFNTKAMDENDREEMVGAIYGLYDTAKLKRPKNIVFVSSPFVASFAGGFAAAEWYLRKNKTDETLTSGKTDEDTAVGGVAWNATFDATKHATLDAGGVFVAELKDGSSENTVLEKDQNNFYYLGFDPKKLSDHLGLGKFGLQCCKNSWRMAQYGNLESYVCSFYNFFKEVAKLDIDWAKWEPWEKAAIHGGFRIMHEDFCIVSDRAEYIKTDDRNRPHCETGPFTKYRDGTSIYALWGTYVPMWLIETPKDKIDYKRVLQLENTEQRYIAMRFLGLHNFLDALNAEVIDSHGDYSLYYIDTEGQKIGPYLRMKCPSTGREFFEGVGDPDAHEFIDPTIKTCEQALAWRRQKAMNNLISKNSSNPFQA